MDYPKLISEKWNLTAKFNCLQAIYFYAPSALAVPMCASTQPDIFKVEHHYKTTLHMDTHHK